MGNKNNSLISEEAKYLGDVSSETKHSAPKINQGAVGGVIWACLLVKYKPLYTNC